jgi:NAD(P)-dependent dehydrogenase (short-subunit alcohol dehydrogenase family)
LSYDLTEFKQVVGSSTALTGKITFVSGSSRGLGALLAIGCAMHGSDVVLHFNRNEAEVARVQDVISSNLGRRCVVVQGDIRKQSTWDHVVVAIRSQFGRLDVFVNNAYPPILPLQLDELSEEMMSVHVFENIKASILAHKALLPLVRESKGCIINISSQYAVKPPKDFIHYAIAKSAVEGLARGLAATTPDVRFLTVRPPKILTEQTNVPLDLTPAVSPFGVVKEILGALLAINQPGHHVVENFDL